MSDRVDSAILKNMHVTNNPSILDKMWSDFEVAAQNKKVILYGLNGLLNFMWMRCDKIFDIVAAIDNDPEKQKYKLGDLFDETDLKSASNLPIQSKTILKNYNPNDVVILISNFRYVDEIANELDESGFNCYFSVLQLEYYFRTYMKENNLHIEDQNEFLNRYAHKIADEYPIQSNKVIISMGTYAEHGKYVTAQLLKMNEDIDIWTVNNQNMEYPKGVRIVSSAKSKQLIKEMETAKVWLYGTPVPSFLVKRKEQIYIQTKHRGNLTLKKCILANTKNNESTLERLKLSCSWIDYILSGCEYDEDVSRANYDFHGKFLRFGSPKSDVMFHVEKYKKKIYEFFNLNSEDKILMYAPTFREDNIKRIQDFQWLGLDFEMLKDSLTKKFGGEWKIFLRLHPAVKTRSKQIKKPNYVIDVSDYGDGQELVAATDVMISDYSTIMFEPAYALRPVFLYTPDKDTYEKNDRELFISYESLPFPISVSNVELAEQIKNFDENKYRQAVKKFLDDYGVHEDGHSSERLAKFVINLLK